MAGVSSESLSAAQAALEAKLPTATLSLAEDLFGILGILDGNAGLRRALTDPAREGKDKAALVSQLLAGKVSANAVAIAASLASSRWGSARDIGTHWRPWLPRWRLPSPRTRDSAPRASRPLKRTFSAFNRVVGSNHELQRALDDSRASAEARSALALGVVPGCGEVARLLVAQAVSAPRGLKPVALVQRFLELVAKRQQRWIAQVSVTRPLTAEQSHRLQAGLNNLYGRELKIKVNVDPTLVGGVRVARWGTRLLTQPPRPASAELRRGLAG